MDIQEAMRISRKYNKEKSILTEIRTTRLQNEIVREKKNSKDHNFPVEEEYSKNYIGEYLGNVGIKKTKGVAFRYTY